jgi:NADH dehydrogenase [ubiquinone] 1 alpha subcomplex assembly factor 1
MMKFFFLFLTVVPFTLVNAENASVALLDAKNNLRILKWSVVNDTVMGGRSKSSWEHIDDKNAKFSGTLSLENNGGFCSVRTYPIDLKLNRTQGILVKVLGDGRSYSLNARSRKTRSGINYRATFATTKDKVSKVWLAFKDFKPTWRGNRIKDLPTLKGEDIEGIGFFLGDKRPGDFSLEIVKIEAMYKPPIMNDNT